METNSIEFGSRVRIKYFGAKRRHLSRMVDLTGTISKIYPHEWYEVTLDECEATQKLLGYNRHFDLQKSELELIVENTTETNTENLPKWSDVEQAFLTENKATYNKCDSCQEVIEEGEEVTLYECGGCGTVFDRNSSADGDSHKCPDCNKFSSKLTEEGCPNCSEELEKIEGFYCGECDQYFDTEQEMVDHFHETHEAK